MVSAKEPSAKAVLEFLSSPAGRAAIVSDPDCPVAIAAKSGNLRVREKTKSYPGARKEDVVEWASVAVPGFSAWFRCAAAATPTRSASRPARVEPEPESSDDEAEAEPEAEPDVDMFVDPEPEPEPEAEAEAEEADSQAAPPAVRKLPAKPAQSASASEVPLFRENPRIRTKTFYDWLREFGFIQLDDDTGDFAFESIPSTGLHQRAARERGFDIGRRFTVADCKAAAARRWGLSPDTGVPNRGNLYALREQAKLTGRALEDALMLERAQKRMSRVAI